MSRKLGVVVKAVAELDAVGRTGKSPVVSVVAAHLEKLHVLTSEEDDNAFSSVDAASADTVACVSIVARDVCSSWLQPLVERLLMADLSSWASEERFKLFSFCPASGYVDDGARSRVLSVARALGWLGRGAGLSCGTDEATLACMGWLNTALHRVCARAVQACVKHCAAAETLPTTWLEAAAPFSSPAVAAAADAALCAGTTSDTTSAHEAASAVGEGQSAVHAFNNLRRLLNAVPSARGDDGDEGHADDADDGDGGLEMSDVESSSSLPLYGLAWTWASAVLLPWAASRLQQPSTTRHDGSVSPCHAALTRSIRSCVAAVSRSITGAVLHALASPSSAFALLRDWPDSAPAVADLALAIRAAPASSRPLECVAAALRAALSARLLQAGAATATLLQFLLDAQRALAALDPSNCLAPVLTGAIGGYLRARPDALRLIVAALRGPDSTGAGTSDGDDAAAEAPSELHSDLMHGSGGGGGSGESGAQSFDTALPQLAADVCGLPAPSAEALLRLRHTLADRAGAIAAAAAASTSARGGAGGGLDAAAAAASWVGGVPIALAQLPGGKDASDAIGAGAGGDGGAGSLGALGGTAAPAERFDPFSHAAEARDSHAIGHGSGSGGRGTGGAQGGHAPADSSAATALSLISAVHPAAAALRGHTAGAGSGVVSGVTATVAPGIDDAAGGLTHDDDGIGSELGEGESVRSDDEFGDDYQQPPRSGSHAANGLTAAAVAASSGGRGAHLEASASLGCSCLGCEVGHVDASRKTVGKFRRSDGGRQTLPWRRSELASIPASLRPLVSVCLRALVILPSLSGEAAHDSEDARARLLLWDAVGSGLRSPHLQLAGATGEADAVKGGRSARLTAAEASAAARTGHRLLGYWKPGSVAAGPLAAAGPHYFPRLIAALTSTAAAASPSPGAGGASLGAGAVFSPLSLVLSLYGGSPAPLLAEHRLQSALALLALPAGDFDVASHERQRELLAARLGEGEATAALADVGIMLRDATDSKRISRDVAEAQVAARRKLVEGDAIDRDATGGDAPLADVLVISHYFWPQLPEERLQLHPAFAAVFEAAAHTYAVKRKPRHLVLQPSQGLVHLTVTVMSSADGSTGSTGASDMEMDVPCTLPQACFLLFALDALKEADATLEARVEHKDASVTLAEVGTAAGMSQSLARQVAAFWVGIKALRLYSSADGLMLALPASSPAPEGPPDSRADGASRHERAVLATHVGDDGEPDDDEVDDCDDDDDDDSSTERGGDGARVSSGGAGHALDMDDGDATGEGGGGDPPEALALWRQFVSGMLTNLGPLPLDRIHVNLKMFAGMGPFPCEFVTMDLTCSSTKAASRVQRFSAQFAVCSFNVSAFHHSLLADDKALGELRALLAGMEADGDIVQQPGQVYATA